MSDFDAMSRKDPEGMRGVYAPHARLVTTYEGKPWVLRQSHVFEVGAQAPAGVPS